MYGAKKRADVRARNFVGDLFKGGAPLSIPSHLSVSGTARSLKLIPQIVQAFAVRPAHVNFRPLSINYGGPAVHLYACWPDAAERLFRPCPFCATVFEEDDVYPSGGYVTDRYHIRKADSGQQLTIDVSQSCIRIKGCWERMPEIASARIRVDDDVRCRPELPPRPQRALALPHQGDPLLGVFVFASRDDLDAVQLVRRFWRDTVGNAAGALALRPLDSVRIDSKGVTIQKTPGSDAMPDVSFDAQWFHIPSYRFEEFRPEDVPILVPLLRHSCALRYVAEAWDMDHFRAVRQHLADAGHAFLAKSVDLDSQDKDGFKVIPSLQLVAGMDASELDLQLAFEGGVAPAIFAREELLRFKRFYLSIGVTGTELSEIQEHCHDYLRKAVGCHVSFELSSCALFSCDYVIERFMAASRSDDFAMPLSLQMFLFNAEEASLKPDSCKYATLRGVAIPPKVLPPLYAGGVVDEKLNFDVYHFHNPKTDDWLTVCLGKSPQGIAGYVFLQKGRILTSPEDIAEMEPFSYD